YSAAVLAAATKADDLRIYTDVSGVMSADPRVVKGAKPLESMSYAEAAELSYFGAKVIHPRTVLPAVEAGIPVRILNPFAPSDRPFEKRARANVQRRAAAPRRREDRGRASCGDRRRSGGGDARHAGRGGARLHRARKGEHQRRRDRSGLERAEHLPRGDGKGP